MTSGPISNIRNFSIIAHIDHGKSTLADRLIQMTGGLTDREMAGKEQVLDSMDIERERGITIKAQTVRLNYHAKDGKDYIFNLMDTPGHVDFAYEVSRSLAACEGSLLVVDASQGVEAQTLANVYHALDAGHEIVPVLNKVDLPAAEPEQVRQQIEDVIGIDASEAVMISAKTGLGVADVLEAIVTRLPPPKGDRNATLKALLVDSWYDVYLGVVVLIRVVDGTMKKGGRVRMMGTKAAYDVERVGFFTPKMTQVDELGPGEIGFNTAAIKEVADTRVGDTITDDRKPVTEMLPGFKPAIPVVFCGLFPVDADDFETLRAAMGKLRLNDASFSFEMETSAALGFGFRCGFLGLLHLEIIQERLHREFDLNLIATAPSVIYKMHLTDGQVIEIHNPVDMPDPVKIVEMDEPWIEATVLTPDDYLGAVAIRLRSNSRDSRSWMISRCNSPRKPQRKPKPRAADVSISNEKLASLRRSLPIAARSVSKSSASTGNRPQNTTGIAGLKPGSMSVTGLRSSVMVSPTRVSATSLIAAVMKPISPGPSSSTCVIFGVKKPTRSTS